MNKTNQNITLKDGRTLGYAEFGPTTGYPIVYCHGSQSSRLEMHYDTSFTTDNGVRIITIDRPGHGISELNPNGTILSFAEDAMELAASLKLEKFSVAGMSAGTPFALAIAYKYPSLVEHVNIISGFSPFTSKNKKYLPKQIKSMLNLAKYLPFLLRIMLKIQSKQLKTNPEKTLTKFLSVMSKPDQEILKKPKVFNKIKEMYSESLKNGSKGVAYEITKLLVNNWGFKLSDLITPVTIWHGMQDNNTPVDWARNMNFEIKNSTINILADEGHLLIFKFAPKIFNKVSP